MAHDVGGKYPATQQADGKWTIKGVPILAPVPKDERRNKEEISDAWMKQAVKRHQLRLKENYKAPTHIRHHDSATPTEPAGTFVPVSVSMLTYEGKEQPVLLADLEDIPDAIYQRIAKRELPFRSIEVAWELGEIQSLALLPDEAPFSKLPLLGISEETRVAYPVKSFAGAAPVAALCWTPKLSAVLLRFNDVEKFAQDDEKKEEPADPKKMPTDKPEGIPAEQLDGGVMQKLMALLESQGTMLQAIMQRIGLAAAKPADEKPADSGAGAEATPHDQPVKMSAEVQAMLGKLSGQVNALESKAVKIDEENKLAKLVADTLESLKEWRINDKTKDTIKTMAALGEVALKAHVESFKLNTPKDPPATFAAYEGGKADDVEVLAFGKYGPKALERARFWANQYEGSTKSVSLKKFVEVQMRSEINPVAQTQN